MFMAEMMKPMFDGIENRSPLWWRQSGRDLPRLYAAGIRQNDGRNRQCWRRRLREAGDDTDARSELEIGHWTLEEKDKTHDTGKLMQELCTLTQRLLDIADRNLKP